MASGAIEHAHAVLLPSDADAGVWEYFATSTIPVPEQVRAVLDVLARSPGEPMSVNVLIMCSTKPARSAGGARSSTFAVRTCGRL